MQTIFKIFNIVTKEVKEYHKPEFGDFGDFGDFVIIPDCDKTMLDIMDCCITPPQHSTFMLRKNTTHELNTLFNGLFKDAVYSNGDWVGVLQKTLVYKEQHFKIGDIFYYAKSYERHGEYVECESEKGYVEINNEIMIFIIAYFLGVEKYYDIISGRCCSDPENLLCEIVSREARGNVNLKGNLLDEYFAGGNELAELFNN